jgi:hypothetical protein
MWVRNTGDERKDCRQGSDYEACYFGEFISYVCHLLKLIHYLLVVHAKMPVYTISINQRSKSGIDHQNNQTIFLNSENSFSFVLGLPSLKNVIGVEIPRCEIHLVSEWKR